MAKKKPRSTKTDSAGSIDFETALAEVERIVSMLESGELGLTEALAQYELGVRQLKSCHAILEQAERKVSLLSGFDADGNPITESIAEEDPQSQLDRPVRRERTVDDTPGLF